MVPLISGNLALLAGYPTNSSSNNIQQMLNARTDPSASVAVNVNLKNQFIQETNNTNMFRAPWVYITNSIGESNGRYAYIILDEWARINPRYHGEGLARNDPTNWFAGSGAMPISTGNAGLFSSNQTTNARAVASSALGLHSLGQVFTSQNQYNQRKHLLSTDDTWGVDIIPGDLPEGGRPKYNLNDLATNNVTGASAEIRANQIAQIINTNLPSFRLRDPSLSTSSASEQQRYLNRLAASIVDYIDSDSGITTVNGGEPAGRDLFPLVTAIAERFRKTAQTPNSTTIESQVFVQVWNPYTTAITNTHTSRVVISNRMKVSFGTGIVTPFQTYNGSISTNVVIRPSEFVVLEYPATNQTWTSPDSTTNSPNWGASPTETADTVSHVPFEFYWDGGRVDMHRRSPVTPGEANAGMIRNAKTLSTAGEHYQVSFINAYNIGTSWRFVGDPRGNYLSNYDWGNSISSDASYANNTRWNGIQTQTQFRWQHYATSWAARDLVPADFMGGTSPGSINVKPSSVPSSYTESAEAPKAIAVVANRAMQTIGELGHIFDPAQADDAGQAPAAGVGANNSTFASGGGRTLRIGQPEFSYANNTWATNGKRAIELIDLFTVNSTNAIVTNAPAARGRINVNTANPEVIEALFFGISPTSDRRFTNSTLSSNAITALVQTITTNRPYNKLSDLHRLTPALVNATNYVPGLSTNTAGTNLAAVVADRAREEAFAKVVELCTVQSRAFRIFVVGQSLQPSNLKVLGQAAVESVVTLPPELTPTSKPIIKQQRWE